MKVSVIASRVPPAGGRGEAISQMTSLDERLLSVRLLRSRWSLAMTNVYYFSFILLILSVLASVK